MSENVNKKVFSGIFWKTGERVCAQGISFIVSLILARLLLPEEYGAVSLIMVFITIANVFVSNGFSSALIQKKDADDVDFSTIFYCSLAVAVVLYGILFGVSPLVAKFYRLPELKWYLRIFSIKILISSYNSVQHAYVSRHMIFKKFFFATLIGTIISGIVGITMAYAGFGAWAIIAQYLVNSMIDTIALGVTVPWRPKAVFSKKSFHELMGFGWKVLATSLIGNIFSNLRSLIIGRYYSTADLAYYNRGQQFPNLVDNCLDASISTVLFPAMANESDDTKRVKEMTRRSLSVSSYLLFPCMAGLVAVARPLVITLLSEKWIECVVYMQILCISQAITTVSKTNLQAMKAIGRSDVNLKLELIKKPIFLLLLIVSIKHGVLAIAISMLVYSFVAAVLNMMPNRKILGYSFGEQIADMFPATVLSIVMCLLVLQIDRIGFSAPVTLFIQTFAGVVIYVGLSHIFKIDSFMYLLRFIKTFKKK